MLPHIVFFCEALENQICDPVSVGFFEGRQIWEVRFERTCFAGFMRGLTKLGPHIVFFGRSLNTKSVIQRRLEFLKAVRFGRYVLNGHVRWASCEGRHSLGRIFPFR